MKLDNYLSYFRIAVCIILLVDLWYLIPYADLIYNKERITFYGFFSPFFYFLRENFWFVLSFHFLSIIFVLLGIFKNFGVFFLLVSCFLIYGINMRNSTYGDDFLRVNLIFFVFVASFKTFSIKRGLPKSDLLKSLSTVALFSMIVHLFYMYFSTVSHKLSSPEWLNGVAFYESLIFEKHLDVFGLQNYFLENPRLSTLVNYTAIAYQLLLLPMVVLSKYTRLVILSISISIHLVLAFVFLLPKFQSIMILHLMLLFFWPEIWLRFKQEILKMV